MRLVTFLGTGNYEHTRYTHPSGECIGTRYVAHAISRLWKVQEVVALATEEAARAHGPGLRNALGEDPPLEVKLISAGRSEQELWQQFEALLGALQGDFSLVLDITHGFRSQPFFAAGALAYLRMLGAFRERSVAVLYGRFLKDEPEESPIWDLTPFIDLVDWAQGAAVLVQTGNADPLIDIANRSERALRRRLAQDGCMEFPPTNALVRALEDFAGDLATVRIASLTTGYAQSQQERSHAAGSGTRLLLALDEFGQFAAGVLPALGPVMARVRAIAEGLAAQSLAGVEGQSAMAALAKRYLEYGRYPEAAITLREAMVSRFAADARGTDVRSPDFAPEARREAEANWLRLDSSARFIAGLRNDIEHGGFNKQPYSAAVLKRELSKLIERHLLQPAGNGSMPTGESQAARTARTYFVSRHKGALDWATEEGIVVDQLVDHLDLAVIQPGDRVLGSLPCNLAAEVCARGGRYFHLSLELPANLRGKELTADDMRAIGAKIEEFRLERVT